MKDLRAIPHRTLYLLGLLGALKALSLVGIATAVSAGVVAVASPGHPSSFLALGVASGLARALVAWAQRVVASRALLGTKERLRSELARRALDGGSSPAATATLATDGLDELDKYYTVFLPALVTAATVPLLLGARILMADWVSALILVLTVPLIPLFMALIGMHTREKVAEASALLGRLSEHLVELARGLPVLVGLGRAAEQTDALGALSERYRRTTVRTLRTAFLSSLALELISTISVAVVAVFIGVRLVSGGMPLEVGLLVLILAPECMAPFRDIGVAFHASQDGRVALDRATEAIDRPLPGSILENGLEIVVDDLTIAFDDRGTPAVVALSFAAQPNGVTLLDGRSGAGKSTVLAVLAGRLREGVTGRVRGVDAASVAWLPQHPRCAAATVFEELLVYGATPELAASTLERLGIARLADASPELISPGELRRLGFARVMVRVATGATTVLLDEPTAQLDGASARVIVEEIERMRHVATVIVASHDEAVRSLATTVVRLGAAAHGTVALEAEPSAPVARRAVESLPGRPVAQLRAFLRPVAGRMAGAMALGVFAAIFAVALTALSGWLIVRAAEHPPIMYLLVAIVGVRFFGIGRAALRYAERLVGHDAVFGALTGLRMRIWDSLAASGLRDRSQLVAGAALDRLVRDVDRVRDLSIRVVLPLVIGPATIVATLVAVGILAPGALPLFGCLAAAVLVVAPLVALWGDRRAARGEQELRSTVLRRLSAALMAADDLRGNAVDGPVLAEIARLDARAGASARRSAGALGLGGAVVLAACAITAVLATTLDGSNARILAVLALVPLALVEPLTDFVAAVQLVPAFRRVLGDIPLPAAPGTERPAPGSAVTSIELRDLAAGWSDDVFTGVNARVTRGDWLALTGPSGSGKSTLVSVLLGHLPPSAGSYLVDGVDATTLDLSNTFGWCPQEGHLFDSTLRGNLLIARDREHAPDDVEMLDALERVGLGAFVTGLPLGLETRIGSEGTQLSGGERQRLAVARALLTRADVIVLDEPTAHLDEQTASLLMADLRVALVDRIVVLVTHHGYGLRAEDARVRLGALPAPADVGARP